MVFPSRSRFKNGDSRLPAAQGDASDCSKLTEEEKKVLCQDDLFEEVKDPDILMRANSAETTVQAVGDLQKEVKLEDVTDVDGSYASQLNAADLLGESDDEKEGELEESFDIPEEKAIIGFTSTLNAGELLENSDMVKEEPDEPFPNDEYLNPKYYSKKTDKRHLYNCPVELCPLSCMKYDHLDEHVKKSHSDKEFLSCDVCMKTFSSLDEAMAHIWQRETRKCCGCGKSYDYNHYLRIHIISVHVKPFFCCQCQIRFAKEEQLEEHKRTHLAMEQSFHQDHIKQEKDDTQSDRDVDEMEGIEDVEDNGEVSELDSDEEETHGARHVHKKKKSRRTSAGRRLFTCILKNCSASYTKFDELEEHTKCHFGRQEPSCDVCKKSFSSKEAALAHIRERQKMECCACGKKFPETSNMVPHLRCHTGEKPFACKTCGKRFAQSGALNLHMLKHSGEKPFSCGLCKKSFHTNNDLKRHETTHYKLYKCKYCDFTSIVSSDLAVHNRKHIGEKRYSCGHCEMRFAHKGSLKKHELTHSGEKPFECSYCGKKFNLKYNMTKHIRIHTGEKPFSCKKCDAKFAQSYSLRYHMKKKHK